MTFRLDISRAYDRVKLHFLYSILVKLGFSNRVIGFVWESIEEVQYVVLVKGFMLFLYCLVMEKISYL